MYCWHTLTRQRFGTWFRCKTTGPDNLHFQLPFLVHQSNLNISFKTEKQRVLKFSMASNSTEIDFSQYIYEDVYLPIAGVASVCLPTN